MSQVENIITTHQNFEKIPYASVWILYGYTGFEKVTSESALLWLYQ